jgi:hypothetical protein
MPRLDYERQLELEPQRLSYAKKKIEEKGYIVTEVGSTELQFDYKGKLIRFYPYSGWASGSTIKAGRGLQNLLNQI